MISKNLTNILYFVNICIIIFILCKKFCNKTKFDKTEFIDRFGEQVVKCGIYFDGVNTTLNPQSTINLKLKDLMNGNADDHKNLMCKLQFDNTDTSLGQYFDDLTGNKKWEWMTVRISYGKWHCPEHYDCEENEGFIICGERYVKMDGEVRRLIEGDTINIKCGQKHEFWSDYEGLNILVNLFNKPPIEIETICRNNFAKDYPAQNNLILNKFWKPEKILK